MANLGLHVAVSEPDVPALVVEAEDQVQGHGDDRHDGVSVSSNRGGAKDKKKKKERPRFTDAQRNALQEAWDNGMKSSGTEETAQMVTDVKVKTGLKKKQVQNWIKNKKEQQNRKEGHGRQRPRPFKVSTISRKGQSDDQLLYQTFRSDYMKGKDQSSGKKRTEVLTSLKAEWKKAKANEDEVNRLTKLKKEKEKKVEEISEKQRKARVAAISSMVTDLCTYLKEKLDYECMFLASAPDQGHIATGTRLGMDFMKRNQKEVIRNFQYAVGQEKDLDDEDDTKILVKKVKELFNKLYAKETQKAHVEYKAIREGRVKVTVTGLPEGVEFKTPGSYSKSILNAIIQAESNIHFKVEQCEVLRANDDGNSSSNNSTTGSVGAQDSLTMESEHGPSTIEGPTGAHDLIMHSDHLPSTSGGSTGAQYSVTMETEHGPSASEDVPTPAIRLLTAIDNNFLKKMQAATLTLTKVVTDRPLPSQKKKMKGKRIEKTTRVKAPSSINKPR